MAKIAVKLEQALGRRAASGAGGQTTAHVLAQGEGWTVSDVVCTCGPHDRPFEEQFSQYTIALVTAGSFQYRGHAGCELMSPGSLVLGNSGQYFECGHEHGAGDRCLAFMYSPEYFAQLAASAGARRMEFRALRVPQLRDLSPLAARARAALVRFESQPVAPEPAGNRRNARPSLPATGLEWEEIAAELAVSVTAIASRTTLQTTAAPSMLARVTQAVRAIERQPDHALTLKALARTAGLSPYHFLRLFKQLTGLTPHQYILRARLRESAARLAQEPARVLDIALDCGFGDVSNFNHAFRSEFGVSPREFRTAGQAPASSRVPKNSLSAHHRHLHVARHSRLR